jgi:hypothetical protein
MIGIIKTKERTMVGIGVMDVVGLLLAALLLAMIGRSLRRAFSRPGPTPAALQAFSLSTGRVMMLVAVLGSVGSSKTSLAVGTSATLVPVLGLAALAVQAFAEQRWQRQSGSIRVALLHRPSLVETAKTRYLATVALAGGVAGVALTFFWRLDPAVGGSAPGHRPLLGTVGTLVLMAAVGVANIRHALRRPSLAGAGATTDQALRQVSVQRTLRALAAAGLGVTGVLAGELRDALTGGIAQPAALPLALGDFLSIVMVICVLALLSLYLLGPTERSLRKVESAAESVIPA